MSVHSNTLKAVAAPKPIKLPLTYNKIPGNGDIKILNYALSLEQLEADLYAQAVMRLTTGGTNALGITIPGLGIDPAQPDVALLQEFLLVEQEHRDFLTSTLGAQAIPPFKYDFGIQSLSRQDVDDLVLLAEQTGVSAYLGVAGDIKSATYLQIAGAIEGTEGRHTAVLSQVVDELFNEGQSVAPLADDNGGRDTPQTPDEVLVSVQPFFRPA